MRTLKTTLIFQLSFSLPCVLLFVALQHPLKEQHRTLALEKGSCAPHHLPKICGLEDSAVALIADFAGVVRGRQLRNLREAYECLPLSNQSLSE